VPEVVNNPEVMDGIERAFKKYAEKYGNLQSAPDTS
jgi:hypothetical protein